MKKCILVMLITLTTILPMKFILCMDNNGIPQIMSSIILSQNDINECTKELKEKYTDIGTMTDHELIREGIIDGTIVIAQAQKNDIQELLSLRKNLYEQYKTLGKPVGESPMDYDYLYGIMKINNKNKKKNQSVSSNRAQIKKSHKNTLRYGLGKIEECERRIAQLILEKELIHQKTKYLINEIKTISTIEKIDRLDVNNKN